MRASSSCFCYQHLRSGHAPMSSTLGNDWLDDAGENAIKRALLRGRGFIDTLITHGYLEAQVHFKTRLKADFELPCRPATVLE